MDQACASQRVKPCARGRRDARTLILAGICWADGLASLGLAAAPGVNIVQMGALVLATEVTLLVTGAWALLRRRLTDAESTAVLLLFIACATTQVLAYDSPNLRWASVYGLAGIPLITLMLARPRWAALVSAACLGGQLTIVASIPATPLERGTAVAIICVVLPVIVGHTSLLLRRSAALRAQAEHAASVDHLTGLLNRRALRQRWSVLAHSADQRGERPAVMLIDVDHFKDVNDVHGHDAGDAVLATLGAHLQAHVREQALVVRLGGEEFAVVDSYPDAAAAASAAERLRRSVARVEIDGLPSVHVSIGVATAGSSRVAEEPAALEDLMTRADAALYLAKAAGRNRVEAADEHLGHRPAVHRR